MSDENESKIEEINRQLYAKENTLKNRRREGVLHPINREVKLTWEDESNEKNESEKSQMRNPKMSIFKKFFIFSIVFLFLAGGYTLYNFLSDDVSISNDKIDIEVIGNAFTKGGEELPLQVKITNNNNANLELSDLIISYPKGVEENNSEIVYLPREKIGIIKPGEIVMRNISITLFGYEKSVKEVNISLEYHPEGSNAIFTKEKKFPVTIMTAPISLLVEGPDSISPDQEIVLNVLVSLNAPTAEEKNILKISYPQNFIFESATPRPSIGDSIWDISSLTITKPIEIEIKGRVLGQGGDKLSFHVDAGSVSSKNPATIDITYNSYMHSVEIVKPFLETRILVNGLDSSSAIVASPSGGTIDISIPWVNNLSTKINDVEIIVKISGNAYDKTSIKSFSGYYDSTNNQIIWNKNTIKSLATVDPGENGSVEFSLRPISLIGMAGKIRDPQIFIEVSLKGKQSNYATTYGDIDSFLKKTIRITTDFQIVSSVYYSAGFIPPKAEGETRYSVEWTLSNSINNVNQAQAKSILPIYVDFIGPLGVGGEKISFNEVTREVIWDIGTVSPIGSSSSNREVSFIVSLRPSVSQVGSVPQLMKSITLTGKDEFSGGLLKNSANPVTTSLMNDPTFGDLSGQVVR
jgi:hypothetical protein